MYYDIEFAPEGEFDDKFLYRTGLKELENSVNGAMGKLVSGMKEEKGRKEKLGSVWIQCKAFDGDFAHTPFVPRAFGHPLFIRRVHFYFEEPEHGYPTVFSVTVAAEHKSGSSAGFKVLKGGECRFFSFEGVAVPFSPSYIESISSAAILVVSAIHEYLTCNFILPTQIVIFPKTDEDSLPTGVDAHTNSIDTFGIPSRALAFQKD